MQYKREEIQQWINQGQSISGRVVEEILNDLYVSEQQLGNAYRMCRELMEPDAFDLFRESQDKIGCEK